MAVMTSESFSQLVRQYERLVYTICFQLVRDGAAAEDLTQETFLSAYLHRDTIPAGYERQWLGRVAANKAKDHLQSAWSRRTVLPGEAEAELSSLAAIRSIGGADEGYVTIFDTGGGSTEFVFLNDGARLEALSVDAGAVTLTDEYFAKSPANPQTVCFVTAELIKKFTEAGVGREEGRVIGAGGNVTAMAAVALGMAEYDRTKIHGAKLEKTEVMRQVALYAKCTAEERRAIPGLSPKRADIILGGACIILAAMEAAKAEEITVSDRSLRHELLRRLCAGEGAPEA